MSNGHYRVLTEKGLRYIQHHSNDPAVLADVKKELHRRGLPLEGRLEPKPRIPVADWEKEHWLR
jgi:hypothetical protein